MGNVYTSGYFTDSIKFDPGTGVKPNFQRKVRRCFYSEINDNGNLLWAKSCGGIGIGGGIFHLSLLMIQGNVYTTGSFVHC
jgi:hypothetical protein